MKDLLKNEKNITVVNISYEPKKGVMRKVIDLFRKRYEIPEVTKSYKLGNETYEIQRGLIKAIQSVTPVGYRLEVVIDGIGKFRVCADYTIFSTMMQNGLDDFISNYPWEKL